MAREKLSKEEKAAQKARQEQIRHLWQSAGIKDIAGGIRHASRVWEER